jgi:molybdate transport system ATP-binding protein
MGLRASFSARRETFEVTIALDVADGETLALLGPNGAGKSTVVDALIGSLPLADGSIELDGQRVDGLPPERRSIGVCFQDDLLFPRLSAIENVAFPLRSRRVPKAEARRRAAGLLERLAPAVAADARPDAMSGGERQRVALARALAPEPRLLLLDEPFANVDVSARPGLRELVGAVAGTFGGATLLIAHEPLDALTLADRVTLLEAGRVTQTGTPDEIRTSPRSAYAADLVGVNLFDGHLEPLDDGAAILHTAQGDVTVAPDRPVSLGDHAIVTLRPVDVSLHAGAPEGSARNIVRGEFGEIAIDGDRGRVRIASRPPLTAEVTAGSVARMDLRPGSDVWASFKAVEVSLQVDEDDDHEAPPTTAAGTLDR